MEPPASPNPSPASPPPPPDPILTPPASRSNWPFFVAAGLVLLPGLLGATGSSDAAAMGALLFAPAGALVSGIVLGVRLGRSPGAKVVLSLAMIAGCLVAAECIAAAGCAVGNPKFNFH